MLLFYLWWIQPLQEDIVLAVINDKTPFLVKFAKFWNTTTDIKQTNIPAVIQTFVVLIIIDQQKPLKGDLILV